MGVSSLESKCAYCGKRLKGRSINSVRLPDESQGVYMARLAFGRVPVCPRCGRTQPWAASLDQPRPSQVAGGDPPGTASDAATGRNDTPLIPILAIAASSFSFLIALFLLISRLGLPSTMLGQRTLGTVAGIIGLGLGLLTVWTFRPSRTWVVVGLVASVLGGLGVAGTMGL